MFAIPAAANIALGAVETGVGLSGLNKLNQTPYPTSTISPELQNAYGRAEGMAGQGFTAAETGNFKQNVAQQENTGYRQGIEMGGGNLASALSAGLSAQRLNSFNQFAGQDASLHRQNIHYADTLASAMQSQKNLITQQAINRRTQLEQAYGGAARQGMANIGSALNLGQATNWGQGFGNKGGAGPNLASYNPTNQPGYGLAPAGSSYDTSINIQ